MSSDHEADADGECGPTQMPDDAAVPEATHEFFEKKSPAAVLKHGILKRYIVPFVSKTGSTSRGNRVVVIDGYAGPGRYADGAPGSPALIAEALGHRADRFTECHFVESYPPNFERLQHMIDTEDHGSSVSWRAWSGTIEDHLDTLLGRAEDVPLLLFLDPFGLGLPYDQLVEVFRSRRTDGQWPPATEILLRFDTQAVFRIRGGAHAAPYASQDGHMRSLDRAAGGRWWYDNDPDHESSSGEYLPWFFGELLHRFCRDARCGGWTSEVRRRPDRLPTYYMLFFTRHKAGLEKYAEVLSLAQGEWRRAVYDKTLDDDAPQLFDPDEVFAQQEEALADAWVDQLEHNVRDLLASKTEFVVESELRAVYGDLLGEARDKHLRAALKRLYQAGITSSDSKGNMWNKRVVRGH